TRTDARLCVEWRAVDTLPGISTALAEPGLVWRFQRQVAEPDSPPGGALCWQLPGPLVSDLEKRNGGWAGDMEGNGSHPAAIEVGDRPRYAKREPTPCSRVRPK